jgi:hypothetical protein
MAHAVDLHRERDMLTGTKATPEVVGRQTQRYRIGACRFTPQHFGNHLPQAELRMQMAGIKINDMLVNHWCQHRVSQRSASPASKLTQQRR